MIGPFGASVGFLALAECKAMTGGLSIAFMAVMISLAASTAGLVFFGWGFDGCRAKAGQVWSVLALVTLLLVFLE